MVLQNKKEKAISLRKKGFSLKQISDSLTVSKSIVRIWCKNVYLTSLQKELLNKRRIALSNKTLAKINLKKKRSSILESKIIERIGVNDVGKTLSKRDLFLSGLSLYWGEGYKKGNNELGFTNSDPAIIKFIIKWLKEIYNIQNSDFILRVSLNETHRDRINTVEKFWSELTSIPHHQFTKISIIQTSAKKEYKNRESHYGTLRIKVRKGSKLRKRILASIVQLSKATYIK